MENPPKKLIVFSSRGGGPYKQHDLLVRELNKNGYKAEHWAGMFKWIKIHFLIGKYQVISNVPLLFVLNRDNFIINVHGNYLKERNILRNPLAYLYPINLRLAGKIIVPSEYLKRVLKTDVAKVIPNSIEGGDLKKNARKRKTIRLVCVTHFAFRDKSFGVLEIIKSLTWLKSNKKIILDIFGRGKFLDVVKRKSVYLRYPKNIKVNFRGYSKNINQELNGSDIFVYWSGMDIMPTSLIEAMAAGLPIVVNNLPQFNKFLPKDNCLCVSNQDFGKSLDSLINNLKLREKIGLKNLSISKNYMIRTNIKRWIKVIYEN